MNKESILQTLEWKIVWKEEHLEEISALLSLVIQRRNDEKLK